MILYGLDDLHFSVNDIHEQWDEGAIHYEDAEQLMIKCCKEFIKQAEERIQNASTNK